MSDDAPSFMRLADGTLINTKTGERTVSTQINEAFSDKLETSLDTRSRKPPAIEGLHKRFLDDLPTNNPSSSRAVALIASYTIFGLHEADIAFVCNIDVDLVRQIQDSAAYHKYVEGLLQNIREHDSDKIRKRINSAAMGAAEKIANLTRSADEKVALAASKDVLDRNDNYNGNVNNGGNSSNSLTIRIIDDRNDAADKIKVEF